VEKVGSFLILLSGIFLNKNHPKLFKLLFDMFLLGFKAFFQ